MEVVRHCVKTKTIECVYRFFQLLYIVSWKFSPSCKKEKKKSVRKLWWGFLSSQTISWIRCNHANSLFWVINRAFQSFFFLFQSIQFGSLRHIQFHFHCNRSVFCYWRNDILSIFGISALVFPLLKTIDSANKMRFLVEMSCLLALALVFWRVWTMCGQPFDVDLSYCGPKCSNG